MGVGANESLIVQAAAPQLTAAAVQAITEAAATTTIVVGGRADRLHPAIAKICGVKLDPPPGSPLGCELQPAQRLACGFAGISAAACELRGCCYDDSTIGAAWCFEPQFIADVGFVDSSFGERFPWLYTPSTPAVYP